MNKKKPHNESQELDIFSLHRDLFISSFKSKSTKSIDKDLINEKRNAKNKIKKLLAKYNLSSSNN